MKNKLEEILNFVCDYKYVIFFIVLMGFIYLGIKYTFWIPIGYVFIFGIIFSVIESNGEVFPVISLTSLMIGVLCLIVFTLTHNIYVIEEIKTSKKIKLLYNKVILFDDMSTLNDEKIYYKCLAYNCKKIIKTEKIKGYKGYNDLFNYSEYSTDIEIIKN
jgi:hypothetical protein